MDCIVVEIMGFDISKISFLNNVFKIEKYLLVYFGLHDIKISSDLLTENIRSLCSYEGFARLETLSGFNFM